MNVANLELCKELYELSGWGDDIHTGWYNGFKDDPRPFHSEWWGDEKGFACPAYDLGYLLRKLPKEVDETTPGVYWDMLTHVWAADYGNDMEYRQEADTPEDAAAKLAIELFKQGILERAA